MSFVIGGFVGLFFGLIGGYYIGFLRAGKTDIIDDIIEKAPSGVSMRRKKEPLVNDDTEAYKRESGEIRHQLNT